MCDVKIDIRLLNQFFYGRDVSRVRPVEHAPLPHRGGGLAGLQLLAGQIQGFEVRRLVAGFLRGRVVQRLEQVGRVLGALVGRGRCDPHRHHRRRREPGIVGRLPEILGNNVQGVLLEMATVHPVGVEGRVGPELRFVRLPVLVVHDGFGGPRRHERPAVLHFRGELRVAVVRGVAQLGGGKRLLDVGRVGRVGHLCIKTKLV